jgi:hypothetical protein
MTTTERGGDVAMPRVLRTRPRDRRGYPVPFIAAWDIHGEPLFTVNDIRRLIACRTQHLCALCGKRFSSVDGGWEMWFVGGARCFLHEQGAFLDPPSHRACAEYALAVCPFLAARKSWRPIDPAKVRPIEDDATLIVHSNANATLPESFGLGLTFGYRLIPGEHVLVVDDWRYLEFWRAGQPVNAPSIEEIV